MDNIQTLPIDTAVRLTIPAFGMFTVINKQHSKRNPERVKAGLSKPAPYEIRLEWIFCQDLGDAITHRRKALQSTYGPHGPSIVRDDDWRRRDKEHRNRFSVAKQPIENAELTGLSAKVQAQCAPQLDAISLAIAHQDKDEAILGGGSPDAQAPIK
jgi:hypothetical protein